MPITIETDDDPESWDEYVARSPHSTPFHQWAGLRLLAEFNDATLHPLIGYKGQQVIGILPVFEEQRGPLTFVESPPKGTEVYYLGPALTNVGQLKQRKYERRNREFIEQCLEWIDDRIGPDHSHIRTVDRYTDHRPFKASGYQVSPYYTYVVDLTTDWDELVMEFSRDARSNIQNTDEPVYEITVGGVREATEIIQRVDERHAAQDLDYRINDTYIEWLCGQFPDGQVKPYVCVTDDGIAGGIITLEYGDTIYRWQGGTKPDVEFPVNDLLDAYIMQDAMERGLERYDLVGANTPRLSRYKSKFGAELRAYHGARKRSRRGRLLSTVRQSIPIDV